MARRRHSGGMPIEEAPFWVLAIFAAILWLVTFPALVGVLAGAGAWHGQRLLVGLAAAAVAALVVAGLATRPRWQRPREPSLHDPRPFFVRFSTWLWTALLFPNVLFGTIVLFHEGPAITYQGAVAFGLLVSGIHAAFAAAERLKRWWKGRGERAA